MSDSWIMGAVTAQDDYRPANDPWQRYNREQQPADVELAPYGVGSPAETANAPSGMGALASSAYNYLGDLAKRSFGASETMRQGGAYNPAPAVEAALMTMGGGVAGTGEGGVAVGAGPIRAYHGSPHDFDKFDLAKIGSGEGAQAYGHGLYFAENEGVAKSYRDALAKVTTGNADLDREFAYYGNDPAHVRRWLQKRAEIDPSTAPKVNEMLAALEKADLKTTPGHMYEVNLHADPAHFLDWDKPLSQHGPEARAMVERMARAEPNPVDFNETLGLTGREIYQSLNDPAAAARTSQHLVEGGIPGIKYLDQGSRPFTGQADMYRQQLATLEARGASQQAISAAKQNLAEAEKKISSNYVVFNPGIIDIMRKYGLAGAAPAGMGALAAQDNYQPQEQM